MPALLQAILARNPNVFKSRVEQISGEYEAKKYYSVRNFPFSFGGLDYFDVSKPWFLRFA